MSSCVICAVWGEYDDFTRVPMFICGSELEAQFVQFITGVNKEGWK